MCSPTFALLVTCLCLFQTPDLTNLVQVKGVRRKCQAIEYGGFPCTLFPFMAKKGEQNYPVYPLGHAEQSAVEGFRSEPCYSWSISD